MLMLKTLYDLNEIEQWIRQRNGHPARVRGSKREWAIDFGGDSTSLEPLSWDQFFQGLTEDHVPLLVDLEPNKRFYRFLTHG